METVHKHGLAPFTTTGIEVRLCRATDIGLKCLDGLCPLTARSY